MRISSIFVFGLAANTFASEQQKVLSSFDLSGSTYQCDNGVKPSIVCNDASSDKHNCTCTCTNGIKFDQPLDPFSSAANGNNSPALETSECETDKNLCLEREQQLMTQVTELTEGQQKHVEREQELMDQLSTYQKTYNYQGCFTDTKDPVLNAKKTIQKSDMTLERCETICQGYKHFGINNGINCFCGNTFAMATKQVAESDCKVRCPGNKQQKCGAIFRLSLYSKPIN